MNNFFNLDNGFFTGLGKICDILFLSVIWVIFCIPIVTIGPANTALYYTTVKVIRRERGYLFREFFKSFRLNFKRGAIIGVLLTLVSTIIVADLIISWTSLRSESSMISAMIGIYIALLFMLMAFSIYVFPILSRFDMTVKQLIKAAAFMAARHLPSTLVMILANVAAIVAIYYFQILIFVVPAAVALINSFSMERVLKKYMPVAEDSGEDTTRDEWFME